MNVVVRHSAYSVLFVVVAALLVGACGDTEDSAPEQSETAQAALTNASPSADGDYLRRTLADGAEFHATNGMRRGPDGNLYVASVLTRSIAVVDPKTGHTVDLIGPDRGVDSPDDLDFGPDGSLYWTSFLTGEVGRLTPDGDHETVAQLMPGVNGIAFSPDGRLFVTIVFLGDALYELDPDGVEPPRLIESDLMGLNAMDFGPDGELYGPLWFDGSVVRVDTETGDTTKVVDGLEVPAAVGFDNDGLLHVVDQKGKQVHSYDVFTEQSEVVVQLDEVGADNVAFDEQNNMFLTNAHDGWVRKVLPSGNTLSLVDEGMVAPGGVAVLPYDGGESVFVADALSVKAFDSHTGQKTTKASSVIGVSNLATPISASPDNGRLLTTSWFANVVQVWDPALGAVVESHGDFDTPLNAVRYQGDLVVAELGTHSVVRRADGTTDKETLGFAQIPSGLATDGDSLWVADWMTGQVMRIAEAGDPLAAPELVADGLVFPEGMAVDNDGTLLVVETGANQVTRIDPATGDKTVVDDGLDIGLPGPPGMPPTFVFNGIDVDDCGNIYVSVDTENSIVKLSPLGAGTPACMNAGN